eukprot:NODE_9457_length_1423_cov_9.991512.p1 GENE.NODE_9457_length_1423_cov_9.991512~~NODE_9457_length_1423_cov_9.991512.p1  ORF type:complete len:379 (+),score=96.57 NODE_9457_length_1423_cov_9.991512:111-1247(+)
MEPFFVALIRRQNGACRTSGTAIATTGANAGTAVRGARPWLGSFAAAFLRRHSSAPVKAKVPPRPFLKATLYSVPLGAAAGTVFGAAGIGSAIILISGMANIRALGFSQVSAAATSCPGRVISCITSGSTWLLEGCVDFAAVALFSATILPSLVIGLKLAMRVPDVLLRLIFGGVIFSLGPVMGYRLFGTYLQKQQHQLLPVEGAASAAAGSVAAPAKGIASDAKECWGELWDRIWQKAVSDVDKQSERPAQAASHLAFGVLVGLVVGLIGAGDTPLLIAYMIANGYTQKEAIGTATVSVMPAFVLITVLHFSSGNICWPTAVVTLVTSGLFASLAAKYSSENLSDETLQISFTVFVFVLGFSLIRSSISAGALKSFA